MMTAPLARQALENDLGFVGRQLELHPDPLDTVRLMWQQRRDDLVRQLASIEREQTSFAQVALLFQGQPVIGSEQIRLDFAAKVLDNYQTVVATLAASRAGKELALTGRLPGAFTSKLFLKDMLRGSVGFLLEEKNPSQYSLVPSVLMEAVEDASHIIATLSAGEATRVDNVIRELSPRTLGAVQRFAKTLHDAGAEARIVSGTRDLDLNQAVTSELFYRLSDVELEERHERRDGTLLGLFPERQQYEFEPAGEAVFYGPVSESFDARYRSDPEFARSVLFKPIVGIFLVNSTFRGGTLQTEEWVLENVEPSSVRVR